MSLRIGWNKVFRKILIHIVDLESSVFQSEILDYDTDIESVIRKVIYQNVQADCSSRVEVAIINLLIVTSVEVEIFRKRWRRLLPFSIIIFSYLS